MKLDGSRPFVRNCDMFRQTDREKEEKRERKKEKKKRRKEWFKSVNDLANCTS
jgi:hypothetical protein